MREITPDEKQGLFNLLTHRKSRLRWNAANEIGKYKIQEGVDALIVALQDEHWLVRLHAAKALGKIGDGKALEPLKKQLDDNCPYVQRRVIVALGNFGDESVIPLLLKAIQADEKMWFYVSNALSNFMDNYVAFALIKASRENTKIWKPNSSPNKTKLFSPILLLLVKFSSGHFKENIIKILGDYGDERAIKDLEILARYHQNRLIRQYAQQSLVRILCRKFEKYIPNQTAG